MSIGFIITGVVILFIVSVIWAVVGFALHSNEEGKRNRAAWAARAAEARKRMDLEAEVERIEAEARAAEKAAAEAEAEAAAKKTARKQQGQNRQASPGQQAPSVSDIDKAYQVLELPHNSRLPDVKKAWRKIVSEYHPDKVDRLAPGFKAYAGQRTREANMAKSILERILV